MRLQIAGSRVQITAGTFLVINVRCNTSSHVIKHVGDISFSVMMSIATRRTFCSHVIEHVGLFFVSITYATLHSRWSGNVLSHSMEINYVVPVCSQYSFNSCLVTMPAIIDSPVRGIKSWLSPIIHLPNVQKGCVLPGASFTNLSQGQKVTV